MPDEENETTTQRPTRRKVAAKAIRGAPGNDDDSPQQPLSPELDPPAVDPGPSVNWSQADSWLEWAAAEGRSIGHQHGHQHTAISTMADSIDDSVPKYLHGGYVLGNREEEVEGVMSERLSGEDRIIVPPDLDVKSLSQPHALLISLMTRCSEFKALRSKGIRIRWSTRNRTSRGAPRKVFTTPVGLADRQSWTGTVEAPWFVLDLSLPWWLVADEEERASWLHHALMQMGIKETSSGAQSPQKRFPDMVSFISTVGRFGPKTMEEGRFLNEGNNHPRTAPKLEEWGFSESEAQGFLFSPFETGTAVKVAAE